MVVPSATSNMGDNKAESFQRKLVCYLFYLNKTVLEHVLGDKFKLLCHGEE